MIDWIEYKVGDIANIENGYAFKSKDFVNEGVPIIKIKNVKPNSININDLSYVPINLANKLSKYQIKKGDILITMSGNRIDGSPDSWVGKVATFKFDEIFLLNQRVSKIIVNSDNINPKYLNYVLGSFEFQNYFINKANSSGGQANISPETVRNTIFKAPDLPTQTSIAEILSSLDDKIELNNKINQELESLAKTLFKQWFVDFEFPNENGEPYKSSGGQIVDSELGEIPKGWKVYSMDELLETISKTFPLKNVNEVVFLNTGDIQDGNFLHKNFSNPKNLPGQAKKSISQNDILYSEIRPANKRFAYVYFDSSQYVVSTKLMVMRSKVEINSLFQYFYLTQQESIAHLQHLAESRSGTFPQITFSEVSTIKIALPDFDLVNNFVEIALKPYYDNQFQIKEENESLIKLRDVILLKVTSGELEINEINN